MFLVFAFEDGTLVIHEALLSSGWREKHGPDLHRWLSADHDRHRACIEWLDVSCAAAANIWAESCFWLGTTSYAWQQILVIGMSETLLGRVLRRIAPRLLNRDVADGRVICSEGAGRLVGTHCPALDLRRPGEPWAMVSPQAWWDRYQARLARRGAARDRIEQDDHGDASPPGLPAGAMA